jgi:hypothetical protein
MVVFASYVCGPKFEYIQREMFGLFIGVITSSEGSTGKTEMIKMLNALFGMSTKAMCASATDAGLYEVLGRIFSCIPICVDDLKCDPKGGSNKMDETIKSLYDAMVRVVYKKMRSSRCMLMVTTNFVFCPNDQPVQSRLLLQTVRKIASFESSLMSQWRMMQSIASMLCVDVLGFPINRVAVQDCIDFMCARATPVDLPAPRPPPLATPVPRPPPLATPVPRPPPIATPAPPRARLAGGASWRTSASALGRHRTGGSLFTTACLFSS